MSNTLQPMLDLEMSDEFPSQPYIRFSEAVHRKWNDTVVLSEFRGGWTALAYRYRACAEFDSAFTESVSRAGDAPTQPDRFDQDHALFGFFVSGFSAIESFCYACFAVGHLIASEHFRFVSDKEKRAVNPETTASLFARTMHDCVLSEALKETVSTAEYCQWKRARNLLTHRTSPGRIVEVGNNPRGTYETTIPTLSLVLDPSTTRSRQSWLAGVISNLVTSAASLEL